MLCARVINNYLKKSLNDNIITSKLFRSTTKKLNNDIESVILKEDNQNNNNNINNNSNKNKKISNKKEKLIFDKMNEAYLRYDDKDDNFVVSFRLVDTERNIDRQFNFSRKIESTVSNLLTRIDVNVTKIINNKIKKKLNKRKNKDNEVSKKGDKEEKEERGLELEECKSSLIVNGLIVDGESICKNVFNEKTKASLIILGNEIKIKYNAPWINNITLSKCILAGFPTYPTKFDAYLTNRKKSVFTWYKSSKKIGKQNSDKDDWQELYQGYIYTPDLKDIGCKLKLQCLPVNDNDDTGPIAEAKSSSTVEVGPGKCPFDIRHSFTRDKLSGECFRITSYNILADFYTDSDYSRDILFPYCPSYALEIDYRKQLIIKELIGYNADIICLQEVDNKVFDCDLIPILTTLDYKGFFNRKGGSVREGLATFFNTKRFENLNFSSIIMSENIDLKGFHDVWKSIDNDKMKERFLCRSTSVQATTLLSIDNPTEILIVGNTHLYFHPDADHIRLLQCYYALIYLRNTANNLKEKYKDKNVSILLCGDFNSVPDCGIYQLMINKIITNDYKDWKSNPEEIQTSVSLSNDLSFGSACGTPQYTNFTVGFADCLDYIFYQTDRLDVEQVIPMPSNEDLTEHTALPSVVFPSDHISLCADLKWKLN